MTSIFHKPLRKSLLSTSALFLAFAVSACSSGSDGEKGKDGENGVDGKDGENGVDGKDGKGGPAGEDGENGVDGKDGKDGLDGKDGKDGKDGVDGTDAATGGAGGGPSTTHSLSFSPVAFPGTDGEKREILASTAANIDGESYPIGFTTLARSGEPFGTSTFGLVVDEDGNPVLNQDASKAISDDTDFSSLIKVGSKLFSITHFETRPAVAYLSELSQDPNNGALQMISATPLDFAAMHGLWVPCAGSVTPWNTHLGSEEYPTNARAFEAAADFAALDTYMTPMLRYYGMDIYTAPTKAEAEAVFNPYMIGWAWEATIAEAGTAAVVKHYAMGRMAFELAYVMPDQKTVYMSDDGANVGFYMFKADTAGQLDAGELFAMKWVQTSASGAAGATANIEWISLGHAESSEIEDMVMTTADGGLSFSDIFTTAAPTGTTCPDGFTKSIAWDALECLKLNSGMELAASRLETDRYASMLGATMELNKEEGITFDPKSNTLFVAISDQGKGMAAANSHDFAGADDVKVQVNSCGVVYALSVGTDADVGSDYVAKTYTALVEGVPTNYVGTAYEGNSCAINGIASPDNITFLPGYDVLIIGEDTSAHQNDVIWSYDLNTKSLTRIQTTPYGSETTSPYWYGDINGWAYLRSTVQHPYGESDTTKADALDRSARAAYTGYIGPFPALP